MTVHDVRWERRLGVATCGSIVMAESGHIVEQAAKLHQIYIMGLRTLYELQARLSSHITGRLTLTSNCNFERSLSLTASQDASGRPALLWAG